MFQHMGSSADFIHLAIKRQCISSFCCLEANVYKYSGVDFSRSSLYLFFFSLLQRPPLQAVKERWKKRSAVHWFPLQMASISISKLIQSWDQGNASESPIRVQGPRTLFQSLCYYKYISTFALMLLVILSTLQR